MASSQGKAKGIHVGTMTRAIAQVALAEAVLREAIADYIHALRETGAPSRSVIAQVRRAVSRIANEAPQGADHDLPERVVEWCIKEARRSG